MAYKDEEEKKLQPENGNEKTKKSPLTCFPLAMIESKRLADVRRTLV